MLQKRIFLLVSILLTAFLALPDDAFAQRRGSSGSSGGSSRASSGGSSRSSTPSRSSSGSSTGSRSRSSGSSASGSSSRPSVSRSTPSSSSARSSGSSMRGSSSIPTYRPSSTPTRSSYGGSTRTIVRPSDSSESRYSGSRATSGEAYAGRSSTTSPPPEIGWRARGATPTPTPTPSSASSQPILDRSGVIDLGASAGRMPRTPIPRVTGGSTASRPAAGTGPSASVTTRSRSSAADVARAREALRASTPTWRSRPLTRDDILSRYRGDQAADATRGADATANAMDGASRARLDAARRDQQASSAERRVAAARANANDRSAGDETPEQRASAMREKLAAREAERLGSARQDYLDRLRENDRNTRRVDGQNSADGGIRSATDGDQPGGQGSGGDSGGGHDDDFDDGDDHHHHFDHHHWSWWGHCYGYYWWSPLSWCVGSYWHHYWWYGGYWRYGYRPGFYWYGPFIPWCDSYVYGYDDGPDVIVIENSDPEVIYVEQGEAVAPNDGELQQNLNRAADYYLGLGDRAFREARFGDAVHFYAKAVEFSPDEGILYLILSDALFATGDYHYAAYSLRKALELDPALAYNVVDKHSFYAEPERFDQQLAVLERYLEDHFLDNDARIVLAANYLFGGRPAAAVDLLRNPFSLEVMESPAGSLLLEAAEKIQYGPPAQSGKPD